MTVALSTMLDEWLLESLPDLYRDQPDRIQPLLRSFLAEHPDIRWSVIIRMYQEERINLGKAAELLGVHELELRERFIELGIPLRLGPADIADAQAEIAAIRTWYRPQQEP